MPAGKTTHSRVDSGRKWGTGEKALEKELLVLH